MLERVRITAGSGRVHVTGEARDDVESRGATVSGDDPERTLEGGSSRVTVRVPSSAELIVGTGSGKVTIDGSVGPLRVTTSSASVEAADAASIDARSSSGALRVGRCHGDLRLRTQSAKVRVERVDGSAELSTNSGKAEIVDARGPVSVQTVSGTVEVTVDGSGPVTVETVSGSIRIRVTGVRRPAVHDHSVTGRTRVDVDQGDDFTISVRSVSGKVTVSRP